MRPLPHLIHARYSTWEPKCGDDTDYRYVDDEYMRTLPFCAKCFPEGRTHSEKPAPIIEVKTILTLRSYLA